MFNKYLKMHNSIIGFNAKIEIPLAYIKEEKKIPFEFSTHALNYAKKYFFYRYSKERKMHSISLIIVGVLLAITICPFTSHATTTESTELEEPKILPLTDAKITNDEPKVGYSEFWQEDDREVLIRNERGAKDNNGQGTTSGKKQNKKEKNQMNNNKNSQKHLNKSPDTNSDTQNIPNNTQQHHQTNVKKHQQKHEKHEKNSKKHGTTEKPKQKDESKENDLFNHFRGMNTFMIFLFYVFTP